MVLFPTVWLCTADLLLQERHISERQVTGLQLQISVHVQQAGRCIVSWLTSTAAGAGDGSAAGVADLEHPQKSQELPLAQEL